MLTAHNLTKSVTINQNQLVILEDVSFELQSGRSLAILGESGSGKTTLLGLLAGLDLPSSGKVMIDEQSIFDLSEEQRAEFRKNTLGFIFQNFQLIDGLTALQNIAMPLELKADAHALDKAKQICEQVGLAKRHNHYPNQLSGGEQQRVAIARAFVGQPQLLLADEPTGNLDTATGNKIIDLMFALNEQHNTTLILVTHDVNLAKKCHASMTLSAGRIVDNKENNCQGRK